MPADLRFENDHLIAEGPITLRSHAATPAQPTTVDIRIEPTAVTVTGQLNLPRGAQIIGLEASTIVADSLHILGETVSDLPVLPALPTARPATAPTTAPALGTIRIDRTLADLARPYVVKLPGSWAKAAGVVVDHQLDPVAYLKYLHRQLAAAFARIEALEKAAK